MSEIDEGPRHPAVEVVRRVLEAAGLQFGAVLDHGVPTFHARIGLTAGVVNTVTVVREKEEQVLFFVVLSALTPESRRVAVAEAITRASYGLRVGAFELDFSDGEVRYRASVAFPGETFTEGMMRAMLRLSLEAVERYQSALMAVMFSDVTPADAIARAEA